MEIYRIFGMIKIVLQKHFKYYVDHAALDK